MKAIAADLGGTHATVALVEDRTILATEVIGLEEVNGLAAVLPLLADATYRVSSHAGVDCSRPAHLYCVSAASQIRRRVAWFRPIKSMMMPRASTFLSGAARAGPFLHDRKRCAHGLAGRMLRRCAQGETDVVMVTLGTGIGGAC